MQSIFVVTSYYMDY